MPGKDPGPTSEGLSVHHSADTDAEAANANPVIGDSSEQGLQSECPVIYFKFI